jgi:flagellar basal-body rod protein FlgG
MIRALFTAAAGMQAQQLNLDNIANNLANVNTAGYKRSRVDFQDLFYQTFRPAGAPVASGAEIPVGIQVGHGSRPIATQRIYVQGDPQETENPLDLLIEGDGFFQVLRPDGQIAYTRAGSFKRDANGRVVTSDGFALQPEISIPAQATSVHVGSDGLVSVTLAGQTASQQVGTLELARFVNPAGLNNVGRNLNLATSASGDPISGAPGTQGRGTISQGFVELSNVKVVEEMVNLIMSQRAYEAGSKAVQAADEMLQVANNIRR